MGDLKPKHLGSFRLHRGKIYDDVENSRKFDSALWERMQNGDVFNFDPYRGFRVIPDDPDYEFPLCDYLLSQKRGLRLSELLGSDVKIVTQRNTLRNIIYHTLTPQWSGFEKEYACERFGNYIFIKESGDEYFYHAEDLYLDRRKQFFRGDDLPGCIGSTPIDDYEIPDVGRAYRILSLRHGDARILYTCSITHFSPDGEPVDPTICYNTFSPSLSKFSMMMRKAVSDGFKHHMFFKMNGDKAQMEFRDTDSILRNYPEYLDGLQKTLDLLLDDRLLSFLSNRRCCIAKIEHEPEVRLRPENVPPTYKSFLSTEFFLRFFDDEE